MERINTYESPSIEIIEIQVEKGFASSGYEGSLEDVGGENGGWE